MIRNKTEKDTARGITRGEILLGAAVDECMLYTMSVIGMHTSSLYGFTYIGTRSTPPLTFDTSQQSTPSGE